MSYSVDVNLLHFGYKAITGTYSVLLSDILLVATSGTFAVTMPDATTMQIGKPYMIKNIGTGFITLNSTGGQTIGGQASGTIIFGQHHGYELASNGANIIVLRFL